jgi:sulfate adenylyltransferase subunit 1
MVTAASTADLAIILIDARKGVLTQTRRHSYLAHLLGIPHIVVAVNKMDLVDYSPETFATKIKADYLAFAGTGHRRRALHPDVGAATAT